MEGRNIVFCAKSLDGYIADKDGGLDWLNIVPNPEGNDMGYNQHIQRIDAIVMGRITFETVCGFDCEWPYSKPVFVISKSLQQVPEKYRSKASIIKGEPGEIVKELNSKGFKNLYIDGGATIQSFLKEDLIDELILTTIPVLLGGGIPLFGDLSDKMEFKHIRSELFLNELSQDSYKRIR